MSLTSVTLHRATADNAGGFHDAGAELKIGDKAEAGMISADRARELLDSHGATGHHTKKAAAPKPAAKRARKGRAKPAAVPAPAPVEPSAGSGTSSAAE